MQKYVLSEYPWLDKQGLTKINLKNNSKLSNAFILMARQNTHIHIAETLSIYLQDVINGSCLIKNAYLYTITNSTIVYSLPVAVVKNEVLKQDNNVKKGCFDVIVDKENLGSVEFYIYGDKEFFNFIDKWLLFFDYLIQKNQEYVVPCMNNIRFSKILSFINNFNEYQHQIIQSKFFIIINKVLPILNNIEHKIRKNLRYTRKLINVEKINQMDSQCLLSLNKLQGESIAQKAQNNRGKLLAVAKIENYDLLENRVLKDFLYRCILKCNDYLKRLQVISGSNINTNSTEIAKKLSFFRLKCEQIFYCEQLNDIPRQNSLPIPNFVLQKDINYKVIWRCYLDIIKNAKEYIKAIDSQQNLFQDICDLLVNSAFCMLAYNQYTERKDSNTASTYMIHAIASSYANVLNEQLNGHRVARTHTAGPFLLEYTSKVSSRSFVAEIVTLGTMSTNFEQQLLASNENFCGAPTYIIFSELKNNISEGVTKYVILPVYSFHLLSSDYQKDIKLFNKFKQIENTTRSIKYIEPIYLVSSQGEYLVEDQNVLYISNDPIQWTNTVKQIAKLFITVFDKVIFNG